MARNSTQFRVTKRMRAIQLDDDLVQDSCSDSRCGVTIWVDKDLKSQGRKFRCTACLLRDKIARGELAVIKR